MKISAKKALESALINKAELARLMFPENKSASSHLSDKIAGRQRKRITDADLDKIELILQAELIEPGS